MRRSITAVFLTGVFGLLGLADVAAAVPNVGPVSGVVVDPTGKPVAGAKVWLVGADMFLFDAPKTFAEATTDEKGQFTIPPVRVHSGLASYPPTLTARDAQGRIGAGNVMMQYVQGVALSQVQVKVALMTGKECPGRMIDAAGKPIAKAAVMPLFRVSDDSSPGGSMVVLPAELQKELTVETDADGRFRFKHFPASGMLYTRIRAGEFGEPLAMMNFGKPVTVRLSRPGALHLTATCPKDPKAVAGLPFFVASSNVDSDPSEKGAAMLYYFKEVKTQDDGTFVLAKIPPGKYMVLSKFPAALPYCESAAVTAEVKSGETAREKVMLTPAVKLQGKVADRTTSKGVAGVRVALFDDTPVFREAVTDAQGTFIIYVKPGTVRVFVSQAPEPYITPAAEDMTTVNAANRVTAPTLLVDRAMPVEALVVDPAGRPIVDAEIRIASASEEGPGRAFEKILRSDAAGKVALGSFSSKQTVAIRARATGAAAPMKTVAVARQKGPVRLVLSEKTAFALRGALVDDAGTPIVLANLKLIAFPTPPEMPDRRPRLWSPPQSTWQEAYAGVETNGITVHECEKLDADGRFVLTGLWPDVQYRLLVKLPGHERYASVMLGAAANKTHDLGKISLARTIEMIEGAVLDTAGKPVADARVFNAGDGPDPMETRTDAAGRFRLTGFRKGPAYVFATKDGYRFAGLRTMAGAANATVTMLRSDEPAPKRPIDGVTIPPEEQKKLARALLEKAWDIVKSKEKSTVVGKLGRVLAGMMGDNAGANDPAAGQRADIVELMKKIDAEQAKRWLAESSAKPPGIEPPNQEDASQQAILTTAEDDIDEAISLLDKDPEQSVRQLRGLTDHFAEKDRAKALRCAEEGVVRARSLDQPNRTTEVVGWGETVARLGNKVAARKLIEEAADTADRWKTNNRYDQTFGTIAAAIAPYDAARAIALLKKISNESYQQAYRMQVATALDDIKQGEALLKDANAETIKSVHISWAYRIAPTRPADAVRAIEGLSSEGKQGAAEDMSPYFARLAELIGTHDSALASSLIDRSMAGMLRAKPATHEATDDRATAVLAARLAVVARKIGYGDMEGLVLRVLALRPTPGKSDSSLPARDATLAMAAVLALTDPASVRPMLQTLEPAAETIEDRAAWLRAWVLVDPHHAAELAGKELARSKSSGDADSLGAVLAAVRLWTLSPDERVKAILPDYGEATETGRRGNPNSTEADWETEERHP